MNIHIKNQIQLLEDAPLSAAIYDKRGRFLWGNKCYHNAFGSGKKQNMLFSCEAKESDASCAVRIALDTGKIAECEPSADCAFPGLLIGQFSRAVPLNDANGQIVGVVEYVGLDQLNDTYNNGLVSAPQDSDATRSVSSERSSAEFATPLLDAYLFLQNVLKYDPNAIAVFDNNLCYIAVSDRYLADYDVPDKSILGKHHYEVFPEIPQRWRDIHQCVLNGATMRSDDDSFEHSDGSITYNRWECRPWYAPDGSVGGMITYTEVTTERKLAEKELMAKRATLTSVIDLVPHMIYAKDAHGRFLLANAEIARAHGKHPKHMLGKTTRELLDCLQDISESFVDEDPTSFHSDQKRVIPEESFRYPDGKLHYFKTVKIPFAFGDPPTDAILGVSTDITEYRKVLQSLSESEARFRGYVENAPYGVVLVDRSGQYLDVNPAVCSITGYSREELLHMRIADIIPEEGKGQAEFHFQKVIEAGRADGIIPFVRKDGAERFWNVLAVRLNEQRLLGFVEDVTEQKEMQDALRQSEETLRGIFDTLQAGLILVDTDGIIQFANPRMAELFGLPMEQVIQSRYIDHVVGSIQKHAERNMRRLMRGEIPDVLVIRRYRRGSNETFYGELSGTRLLNVDGSLRGLVGTITDITDREQAEQALRESEEQYRLLADNTLDMIWTMDLDLRFTYINPAITKYTGHTPEEWIGSSLSDHCNEEHFAEMGKLLEQELGKGPKSQGAVYETEMLRKDGSAFPIEIHGKIMFDEKGAPVALQGTTRDITERKKNEEALRQQRDLSKRIIDESPLGITIVDTSGVIVFANQQAENTLRLTSSEITDRKYNDPKWRISNLDGGSFPDEQLPFCQVMATGKSVHNVEHAIHWADGTRRSLSISAAPLHDASGRIERVVCAIEDVTERHSIEAQLRQAQKMESVGRLAGGVAHDFNNMLSVILGYTNMLLKQDQLNERTQKYLLEIAEAGKRSSALTRQLLGFARKQTVAPEILDINDTIETMLELLRRLIGEDIDLSWQPCAADWQVRIDPSQVDQILVNLSVNARDAIKGVGKISIETENTRIGNEYCRDHVEAIPGEYLMLSVSDDGCGMSRETLEHIFEPFFTTKGVGEGTGLGLATVYGIVKQNNGFVNVYSELEHGTTFHVYIPRYEAEPAEVAPLSERQELPGGSETLLLVEDEALVRDMIALFLQEAGYTVLTAESPEAAIDIAEEYGSDIALLVTDMVMPGMNGRELSEHLRRKHPAMRCLYISGYTAKIIANRGILEEGMDFLSKPFGPEEVASKVREILDRK